MITNQDLKLIASVYKARNSQHKPTNLTQHLWNQKTFNEEGYPVALCSQELFPQHRDLTKETKICIKCIRKALK